MSQKTYLDFDITSGLLEQKTAPSTTAPNVIPSTGADGRLHESFMPIGIAPEVKVCLAYETLAANNLVNFFNDEGVTKARKADASNGRFAHAFVKTPVSAGQEGTFYMEGSITGLTGKTRGARQYLSADNPGLMVENIDSSAGEYIQHVGIATDTTEVNFFNSGFVCKLSS